MAEFYYNDGTAVRKVREFYYNDGTAVRKIKEAYYNDGTGVRKFYQLSTGTIVSPFTAWHVESDALGSTGTTTASLSFLGDGRVTYGTTLIDSTTAGSSNWLTPTTTGAGSAYWIRATATSGSISTGVVGSWLSLASDWGWSKSGTSSSGTVTLTFEIATDSLGSSIVFTSTGNTLAFAHNVA